MKLLSCKYLVTKLFATGIVVTAVVYAFTNNDSAREMILLFIVLTFTVSLVEALSNFIKGN